ncbi:MAG: short-chain dehydrogenase/reductase, partial [Flavisolibacter sp.]|nr:short-chain dehydrogenase/reductase [Flavisolibacter sp.]
MVNENVISRRQVIGGIGAGIATLMVSPVLAGSGPVVNGVPAPDALEDPTTKYPRPPFKSQSQPWPGLVR